MEIGPQYQPIELKVVRVFANAELKDISIGENGKF